MRIFVLTLLSAVCIGVFAQNATLTGTVKDTQGEPLPGANIYIVGQTSKGVTSSSDGTFSLSGISNGDVIRFAFVGYQTQDITYRGQLFLNIILEDELTTIDE
ncbi:MAG: carboxypeptidase-like regulatory domain-containing protein, partial [Flavobacteriales bacterium]|nr:carboxypeptidase-like regulatory domain-containing protein [Flavobacteriales bacterium]